MKFVIQDDEGKNIENIFCEQFAFNILSKGVSNLASDVENYTSLNDENIESIKSVISEQQIAIKNIGDHLILLQQNLIKLQKSHIELQKNQITKNDNFFKKIISAIINKKESNIKTSTVEINKESWKS